NIVGAPSTYTVDGEQYVAVVAAGQARPPSAGGGGVGFANTYWAPNYARLLVYKLGGKVTLPEATAWTPPPLTPPADFGNEAQLAQGEDHYNANCASCHGNSGRVSSIFPDLRYAGALHSAEAFKAIVIDGALEQNGMVSFRKVLKAQDAEAIRAYVTHLANEAKNAPPGLGAGPGGPPPGAAPQGAPPQGTGAPGAGATTPSQPAPHQ